MGHVGHITERPAEVRLGTRIRISPYFDYYRLDGRPGWFAKVPTTRRVKTYLGLSVRYPTTLYTAVKFGLTDLIRHEQKVYEALRPDLEEYLPRSLHRARCDTGRAVLCGEWPVNYDATAADFACQHGLIDNEPFWRHVDRIVGILRGRRAMLLGVFTRESASVLVHKVSPEEWRPVMIDFLKAGRRMYYYQFWMHRRRAFWGKFDRGLAGFVAVHRKESDGGHCP